MAIAAALMVGVFMIASGTLSLSEQVVSEGRTEGRREAFLNFLEQSFEELPGNSEIRLLTAETSERLLPTLTIQNAPTSFAFEGLPVAAQAVVIRTVPIPTGGLNVVLDYYEEQLLNDQDALGNAEAIPVGSIVLYRDIWRFELRALDINTLEFLSEWEIRGRRPVQIEMNAVFSPDGEEVVHHFWMPSKANPAQITRSSQQQQRGRGRGATPESPDAPTGISIPAQPGAEGGGPTGG